MENPSLCKLQYKNLQCSSESVSRLGCGHISRPPSDLGVSEHLGQTLSRQSNFGVLLIQLFIRGSQPLVQWTVSREVLECLGLNHTLLSERAIGSVFSSVNGGNIDVYLPQQASRFVHNAKHTASTLISLLLFDEWM